MTFGSTIDIYRDYGIIVYARVYLGKAIIVCINNNDYSVKFNLPLWLIGVEIKSLEENFATSNNEYVTYQNARYNMENGNMTIYIGGKSSRVFESVDYCRISK